MDHLPEEKRPAVDLATYSTLETATLAMGCFWKPEALFGAQPGVVRTRVGYAGGTTPDPTYRHLAEHMETVQLEFDPSQVTFLELLRLFFAHHTPTKEPYKRQYTSAIFYHSPEQEKATKTALQEAEKRLEAPLFTEVNPFTIFYLAEERHQKWNLRRTPDLLQTYQAIYPKFEDFNHSTAVARVNGYLGGFEEEHVLMEDLGGLGLPYEAQNILLAHYLALGKNR
ncbi:peptide-methionine (S)-S-oxide reductase MsrA [Rufibacter radiotolerans]|uniref:peptide-methionine (S)-S-oxide reductase MsrA n=1 Tax=Rufibacter radiotolerans TaxID=1379910 RepID=UPI00069D246D|nr:peptide-methionine (S)-S-oxide reductase MsrA [Rufibacter radiotolerans]